MGERTTTLAASRVGRWASVLSLGCAVHCVAMPLLVAVLPMVGMGFLLDERVETAVIGASVALAAASLSWGFRSHHRRAPLFVLVIAVVLLGVGRSSGSLEKALTVAGALTLAGSQFLNRRYAKSCGCCHAHAHDSAAV